MHSDFDNDKKVPKKLQTAYNLLKKNQGGHSSKKKSISVECRTGCKVPNNTYFLS
jgi:hypothetical protein